MCYFHKFCMRVSIVILFYSILFNSASSKSNSILGREVIVAKSYSISAKKAEEFF